MVNVEKRRARQKRYDDRHKEEKKARSRKWYLANREKIKPQRKVNWDRWYKENAESQRIKMRQRARQRAYGINPSELAELLVRQNNRCAICRSLIRGKQINVDHCHNSKRIRGLLCRHCNLGLGNFKDDVKYLLLAVDYLYQSAYAKGRTVW